MLIGRSEELARLVDLLAGDRGAAVVVGEAGAGKTTLVRHVATQLTRPLVEAGSLATLSWAAYMPVRRALGRPPRGQDAAFVAGELIDAVGDGILFLDDLQWADTGTLRLPSMLVGHVRLALALRVGDPATPAVLESVTALGIDAVDVDALCPLDAADLVAYLRPELPASAVAEVVRRSAGNPLLLEELARTDEPTQGLTRLLSARLRTLTEPGRAAFSLLALAGRPLGPDVLVDDVAELRVAGLATDTPDGVAIRHAVIAETAVALLSDDDRRAAHALLARRVTDPGESARHHAAAGESEQALAKALAAAEKTGRDGERAAHLALAASVASVAEAPLLRLRAARALCDAHEAHEALAMIESVTELDDHAAAEARLVRARAAWETGDVEAALAHCRAGRALADDAAPIATMLDVEEASIELRLALVRQRDLGTAHAVMEEAARRAAASGVAEADALRLLGTARLLGPDQGWERLLRRSLKLARAERDSAAEFATARTLAFGLILAGRPRAAHRLAVRMVGESTQRRFRGWEMQFRYYVTGALWHIGRFDDALAAADALTALPGSDAGFYRTQVLADVGRHGPALEAANAHVAAMRGRSGVEASDWYHLGQALWALTDVHYAGGRYRESVAVADEALSRYRTEGPTAFLELTRAWARVELGLPIDADTITPMQPIVDAAPIELAAIRCLSFGSHAEAADLFEQAASLWAGRHFRGELRCRWASAEARRRLGAPEARERLERLEALASRTGAGTQLARIRRSLRLAGVRRSAPRGRTSTTLTGRESEVLALVREGLTNQEIAVRLGVGRPTVARIVATASRKLGARTRVQAAELASRPPG